MVEFCYAYFGVIGVPVFWFRVFWISRSRLAGLELKVEGIGLRWSRFNRLGLRVLSDGSQSLTISLFYVVRDFCRRITILGEGLCPSNMLLTFGVVFVVRRFSFCGFLFS